MIGLSSPGVAPVPELWGGVECTVNRVGDAYFDQLMRNGHHDRVDDFARFGRLGIRAIRFPLLWERTAPQGLARADWTWADRRLEALRELGIRPIVGLVHHGSGPSWTNLLDPGFATGLEEFARAVAERYPWVEDYTPVNEPLTTARFSCLYAFWYPHRRDLRAFVRAVLTQCRATVLAMRAIRAVTPAARLIQTEDAGAISGTPELAHQVEYENHRRWLSIDLLTGRVGPVHPLWDHLCAAGAETGELEALGAAPCPPEILGLNYYVISDRFLDHRLERYPARYHGGNGLDRYADVDAVRAAADPLAFRGHAAVLREAWERYRLPVALTEVHLDGRREDQMRWLADAWHAALETRREGVDVRAVTLWALLGSYDWNELLIRANGYYESGVFDVRGARPRPTALARMAASFAKHASFDHPIAAIPGWWRRPDRLTLGDGGENHSSVPSFGLTSSSPAPPILITGSRGTLGTAFTRICEQRCIPVRVVTRAELDIADAAAVERVLDELQPWAVINAAGYVRVDQAELERERCYRENVQGSMVLAHACRSREIQLVIFSSDLVFDGAAGRPYIEGDPVAPLCAYGASKAEADSLVRRLLPSCLIVRTSAFFGPWDRHNLLTLALDALEEGRSFCAAGDLMVSPTYVPDLVHRILDLLIDKARGLWHLANQGAVTWAELVRQGAALAGFDPTRVVECDARGAGWTAPRPRYSVLGSRRGLALPALHDSLARYVQEREKREHA